MTEVLARPRARRGHISDPPAPAWQRTLVALPDAILLPLLWVCLTVTVTILLRVFTPWLVVPIVVVASVLTWRWRPARYVGRWAWQSSLAAMLAAIAWLVVNIPLASPWLTVTRDPGFLTLEGVWLTHHSGPNLPAARAANIAAQIAGARAGGNGFKYSDGVLHVQGAKLVPGLAAMLGWVGGLEGVLVANLVIGAIALLAVYGFGRRLVGPVWSLAATAALGVSMPFIAFTRSVYTEPIVVAVTFGGLTLLWAAYRSRRWTGFLAGGALLGAGGLARIDGAAVVAALTLALVLAVVGTTSRARAAQLRGYFLLGSGASLVVTLLGLGEMLLDSPQYTAALSAQWHELVAATLAAFVGGVLITLRPWWRPVATWAMNRSRGVGAALAAVVVAVAAGLASRPLWYVARHGIPGTPGAGLTTALERAQGLAIDPTRTWDEQSLNWVAMYFSWIVVAAALLGLAFALRRAIVTRDPALLMVVTIIAAPSLLYLWDISITPDQIWAMRRFLPVTVPGFLLFAAWAFRQIVAWLLRRRNVARVGAAIAVVAVAAVGFAFPVFTWHGTSLFTTVQYGGQLGQVNSLCAALDGRPALVVSPVASTLTPTITTVCGVDAISVTTKMTQAQIAGARNAFGSREPIVVTQDSTFVQWAGGATAPAPFSTTAVTTWPLVLNERPTASPIGTSRLWLGTIDASGRVVPIPPTPAG